MPREPNRKDEFLVVLLPTLHGQKPSHRIHHIERGDDYGVEIAGPARTTRWWFNSTWTGTQIEVRDSHGDRTHDLLATSQATPTRR